jgi:hypothetical protein
MDLNCELIERETLRSSLHLAQQLLIDLEVPAWDAANIVARFQLHDEKSLQRQHAVYHDETQLIQSAREAASELEDLLQQDREEAADIESSSVPFSPSDVR